MKLQRAMPHPPAPSIESYTVCVLSANLIKNPWSSFAFVVGTVLNAYQVGLENKGKFTERSASTRVNPVHRELTYPLSKSQYLYMAILLVFFNWK